MVLNLKWQRPFDWGLALSMICWGIFGFLYEVPSDRLTPGRVTISVIHLVVASLILFRKSLKVEANIRQIALAIPCFLLGGIAVKLSRPLSEWPLASNILFVCAGLGALISLISLGRCFAILPGARGVVARGPYAIVRHPAYSCELLLIAACSLAIGLPLGPVVMVCAIPLTIIRIAAEEGPLRRLEAYQRYSQKVRWRLVPFVY